MKRRFNKKQRIALAQSYDWKCALCGCELPSNWHADHKVPFSKNGDTDVLNGQPLCPTCNLKKGNKLMKTITLRNWQKRALTQTLDAFDSDQKLFLTHATPGGGKTIHGLSVFNELRDRGRVSHLVILAPSTTLVNQWMSDAKRLYNIELSNSMIYSGHPSFNEYDGVVMTYQAMNEIPEALRLFCGKNRVLVCADEIHHVSDGQSWGDAFRHSFEPDNALILALTGTPWGSNGKRIAFVEYSEDGYALPDFSYDKKRAIADSVCRVTQFHRKSAKDLLFINSDDGTIFGEYEELKDAVDDNVRGAYRKTLQSLSHFASIFKEADEELSRLRSSGSYDAGGLIVAPDIPTAHNFQDELFSLTGQQFPIVHSKTIKPHEKINDFRDSKERWLISVDMVTEGVDIKRLQVCIFLSIKNTELFLRQVIGRIERIRDPDSYIDRHGSFYYTDIDEINEIVNRLIEENKAGLALIEEKEKEKEPGTGGCGPVLPDFITLDAVRTEQNGLVANGHYFDSDVVAKALKRKNDDPVNLSDIPTFIICKMIKSDELREANNLSESLIEEENYQELCNVPLSVKKERIRSRISKEINRKLAAYLNRVANGKEIQRAHANINKRCGIYKTDDSISYALFEKKMEFISRSEVRSWL